MHLDGARADEQSPTDLSAREAVPNVLDNLELPPGQAPVGQPTRLPAAEPAFDRLAECSHVSGDHDTERGGAEAPGCAGGRDQDRNPVGAAADTDQRDPGPPSDLRALEWQVAG